MKQNPALVAAFLACSAATGAHAQSFPDFKFGGFGTLAGVHSSEDRADFVGSSFQPKGAGVSDDWSFAPDSKLGVQGSAVFGPSLSAVVQLVSQQNADNDWVPHVEWANLKWQATPGLAIRVGRTALPVFQVSETRLVGYANTTVRPAQEIYRIVPITSNDGVDLSWRTAFGGATHEFQAFAGRSKADLPTGEIKSDLTWGVADTVTVDDLSLRAGYTSLDVEIDAAGINALMTGIRALAPALESKYRPDEIRNGVFSLGFSYDPGRWFVAGEAVRYTAEAVLADANAWQLMSGWRIGAFTPYVGYARIAASVDRETAAGGLNVKINETIERLNGSQKTATLGLRWDVVRNAALKLQYDRTRIDDDSYGRLWNVRSDQPGNVDKGGRFELFTVAVDFVF